MKELRETEERGNYEVRTDAYKKVSNPKKPGGISNLRSFDDEPVEMVDV